LKVYVFVGGRLFRCPIRCLPLIASRTASGDAESAAEVHLLAYPYHWGLAESSGSCPARHQFLRVLRSELAGAADEQLSRQLGAKRCGLRRTPARNFRPRCLFPTAALAPAADFVGSQPYDRTTHCRTPSPMFASPFTPSRQEGDSAGPAGLGVDKNPGASASLLRKFRGARFPPAHGPSLQIESVRKRTQGDEIIAFPRSSVSILPAGIEPAS